MIHYWGTGIRKGGVHILPLKPFFSTDFDPKKTRKERNHVTTSSSSIELISDFTRYNILAWDALKHIAMNQIHNCMISSFIYSIPYLNHICKILNWKWLKNISGVENYIYRKSRYHITFKIDCSYNEYVQLNEKNT